MVDKLEVIDMGKFMKSTKNNVKFIDSERLYEQIIDHESILIQIHDLVDFEYYRPILEPLYSDMGRDAYDCVFMFKICLLQFLKGGLSDREVVKQIRVNLEYRYFLDMSIDDQVPHATKIGTFRKRLGEEKFRELFEHLVEMLRKNQVITKEEVRYMDATHQIADVAKISINALIANACKEAIEVINANSRKKCKVKLDLEVKDYKLTEDEQKLRFVELVELAKELMKRLQNIMEENPDFEVEQAYEILARILRERTKKVGERVIKENSKDTGKIASVTDKDATWGSKSKKKQFLGYKHNVTATESGFIEVISTHQGHEADEQFYRDDAKKTDGDKIVTDTKYGSLDNRKESRNMSIELVAPVRKNMKAHLREQIMDDALLYSKTEQYNKEMKKRGSLIEGIFGTMKNHHAFARAKLRGLRKVSIQALITAFVINLKTLVKWYQASGS